MAENVFIHYGSYCYDPARYVPVRNCSWKPKPEDGTGLWASRENLVHEDGWMNYGWKEWCEDSGYRTFSLKRSFRFRLRNGSKSIILKEPADLLPLPKTNPWSLKQDQDMFLFEKGQRPTMEQMQEYFKPNPCYLDYEKLRDEFAVDAIELQHSMSFRRCLDTWDCDCIVILNPEIIEVVI